MQVWKAFLCLLLTASLASTGLAQQAEDAAPKGSGGQIQPNSVPNGGQRGLGITIRGPIDVEGPTGDIRCLGAEYGWGFYWVTGTNDPFGQQIYQFDLNGNLIASFPQVTTSPFWGHRDIAVDEANNKLYAGNEAGEVSTYDYNPATMTIAHSATAFWAVGGTARALARHPGTGNFFVKDFSSDIEEVDPSTGAVVNTWVNPGTAGYGAAWDTDQGTLWINGQDDNGFGNLVHLSEWDMSTPPIANSTGREFWAETTTNTGIAGGLGFYNDPLNPNGWTLIAGAQDSPDQIIAFDATGILPPLLEMFFLIGGLVTTGQVERCTPGGQVVLAFSLAGAGPTNTPCGPASLSAPFTQLPPVVADANGTAYIQGNVPAALSGANIWIQAADLATCTLSNPLAEVIG